jgi:hypothetical protein
MENKFKNECCYGWYWDMAYVVKKALEKNIFTKEQIEKLEKEEFGKCETCLYWEDCHYKGE